MILLYSKKQSRTTTFSF